MSIFFHEQLYRTDAVMAKPKEFPVTICGAGALGANLAENLVRASFGKLKVIDLDVFDNSVSRQAVKDYADRTGTPCPHAELSADYAEVIWNDVYRVPSDVNDDVCDYPLARNLVMLTVAVACEAIVSFVQQENNGTSRLPRKI